MHGRTRDLQTRRDLGLKPRVWRSRARPSDVTHKSGTLEVTYTLTTIAKQKPTVSFLGFNGVE